MTTDRNQAHVVELKMSRHASTRQQQRGVVSHVLDAVLTFGDVYLAGEGCVAYYLGKDAVHRHRTLLRSISDHARNVAVVVSPDGTVVSVQHVRRPKRRWRAA